MTKKVELFSLPYEIYIHVGELVLLFAQIEWLIANALLYSEISTTDYKTIKDLPSTQVNFETFLKMKFFQKLVKLKGMGYDTAQLEEIGDYRNLVSHGLIYKNKTFLKISSVAKKELPPQELSTEKLLVNIELLKIEGGSLLDFIEGKGYVYISQNELPTS